MPKNIKLRTIQYLDHNGLPGLYVEFFLTRQNSVGFRTGTGPKRWNKSKGPYPTFESAFVLFHNQNKLSMPKVYSKDYSVSYTKDGPTDAVATIEIQRTEEPMGQGYYGLIEVGGRVTWTDSVQHTTMLAAYLAAFRHLRLLYPTILTHED